MIQGTVIILTARYLLLSHGLLLVVVFNFVVDWSFLVAVESAWMCNEKPYKLLRYSRLKMKPTARWNYQSLPVANVVGQSETRHATTSVGSPVQLPSLASFVCLVRVLVCVPSPHVVEQGPLTHAFHTQSTTIQYIYMYIKILNCIIIPYP